MFHQWESYLSSIDLPEKLKGAVGMAFQVILTCAMKKLIACVGSHGDSQSHVSTLSLREKNAIHYMAGYVIMRLFRKFKRAGNQYCIEILKRMEADKLPSIECAADAPYQLWTEMADRGGLRQSSKEVN